MSFARVPVAGDEFVVGFASQRPWGWSTLIATAFFLGKIGAGTFFVSLFLDFVPGMILGLFVAVVCKGIAHVLYLGRKERFWRIAMNPTKSWISRGIWAMGVLAFFGLLKVALVANWFSLGQVEGGISSAILLVAALAALFVMVYDGFVMSASPAIPLWNTALLPILCLSYSALGGVALTTLFMHLAGVATPELLDFLKLSLLAGNLAIVMSYVLTTVNATAAARAAMRLLIRGQYSPWFWGGVVVVGLVIPLIAASLFGSIGGLPVFVALAAADLIGHYLIFYVLLKAATYSPIY